MSKSRLFVLGASDPEMVAIETILRVCGEKISFACDENHKRVHPGNAYKAAGVLTPRCVCAICGADASTGWCQYCNGNEPAQARFVKIWIISRFPPRIKLSSWNAGLTTDTRSSLAGFRFIPTRKVAGRFTFRPMGRRSITETRWSP